MFQQPTIVSLRFAHKTDTFGSIYNNAFIFDFIPSPLQSRRLLWLLSVVNGVAGLPSGNTCWARLSIVSEGRTYHHRLLIVLASKKIY